MLSRKAMQLHWLFTFRFDKDPFTSKDFPDSSVGKESTCSAGDPGSISGLGRSPGEGKGYPLQYSGLENHMHRGAWQATVHGSQRDKTE